MARKYVIETFGCQMNVHDSERMAGLLEQAGYESTADAADADVVGRKLRTLGSAFQVLCITHLPQIAACADTHFQIDKCVERGRTKTTVTRLTPDGRVDELARMLGGEAITDGLKRSAREMLEERRGRREGAPQATGESERAKAKGGRRR